MKLHQAFEIVRGDVVSFIGAGGKTSALVGLGYELAEAGWRVLASTTTRLGKEQLQLFPHAMSYEADANSISQALTDHRFVFLYDTIERDKVYGPSLDWIQHLPDSVDSDILLIEADGARGLPLKAPYEHEPVIPTETTLVIPVASLSVLGKPLDGEHVYNPEAMTERYGFYPGSRVKSPWVAQVMRDEQLGLQGIPAKARIVAFLNQTPARGYLRGRARMIARLILQSPQVQGVALGAVRGISPVHEVQRPVGAIVLAAGLSSRMGQPKVLLPWENGKTIIEHIVDRLLRSRLEHIRVVTGHYADEVKGLVKPLGVKIAHNRSYKTGEMLSSLKAGLRAMPDNVAAALIVLGDQPRLDAKVINQILTAYAEGAGEIIAPSYQMRRGHPILVSRRYWQEFLALPRKGVPRDVINAHQDEIAYIPVRTDSILNDVDTLDDYQNARHKAGLARQHFSSEHD